MKEMQNQVLREKENRDRVWKWFIRYAKSDKSHITRRQIELIDISGRV